MNLPFNHGATCNREHDYDEPCDNMFPDPKPHKLRPEDISPISSEELAREIIAIQGNSPEARMMAEDINDPMVRAEVLNYIENAEGEPAY